MDEASTDQAQAEKPYVPPHYPKTTWPQGWYRLWLLASAIWVVYCFIGEGWHLFGQPVGPEDLKGGSFLPDWADPRLFVDHYDDVGANYQPPPSWQMMAPSGMLVAARIVYAMEKAALLPFIAAVLAYSMRWTAEGFSSQKKKS